MNCKETLFEYITSIEAYPFSGTSTTRTMAVHCKHVTEAETGVSETDRLSVPMKPKSGEMSEKTSVDLPGESYEVTVSWQILFVDNDTYQVLEQLHEYPKHLILRTYDNKGYFIRCEEEGYEFSYTEKDGLLECELTVHNKNGAQRLL